MANSSVFSVLFVCTGNTCRSPMAQALLESKLPPELRPQVRVSSAGVGAADGAPASPNTVSVLSRNGVSLRDHRSRKLTREQVLEVDLVLAVTPEHRRAVLALAPEAEARTFVLSTYGAPPAREDPLPVHDPVGGSLEIYEETYRRISTHLDRVLPEILSRVGAA
ncbi:MAG TPA: low molecular weight protein arginine phosphatase [Candidatus Saccharimonadales bacterium]|nr:low molecular weight protein arginine phosphatase [Candidatus Saccharimonadales bacterium]